ncbi:MAG: hypothetical protein OK457_10295, partial [Thaumarchaeota archaeon]|nr:hypothetical protein [Nitrososphaerota archaeon]
AIVAVVRNNYPSVASANGSLLVESIVLSNSTTLSQDFPYRIIGEGLIGLGAFGLFLIAWNPKLPSLVENRVPRKDEQYS